MSRIHWPAAPGPAGAALLALHYQLAQSEWWAPELLERHQYLQLADLLAHARETVPGYRSRLTGLDLTPAGLAAGAFAAVPLLPRSDVQTLGETLRSPAVPADHGRVLEYHTSGATGQPLRGYWTEFNHFHWGALNLRDHLWHRRDFAAKFAAIRTRVERARLAGWGPAIEAAYDTGPAVTLPIHTPVAEQLAWLCDEAPAYLLTHASDLRALVLESRLSGRRPRGLREAMSFGEALPEDLRALCRSVWEVPLTDLYSCEEAGYLALECPDQPGSYHVQAEHVLLEVLDDAGRPCAPGTIGRVALTTLHNYAMPLVRYLPGDYAEPGPPCTCGRGLPVLRRILGRTRNLVRLPDGSRHWPSFPAEDWLAVAPVRRFQLRQRTQDAIDVQVAAARTLTAAECDALAAMLQARLRHPFTVRIEQVADLPPPPNGKFEDFVCELPDAQPSRASR